MGETERVHRDGCLERVDRPHLRVDEPAGVRARFLGLGPNCFNPFLIAILRAASSEGRGPAACVILAVGVRVEPRWLGGCSHFRYEGTSEHRFPS